MWCTDRWMDDMSLGVSFVVVAPFNNKIIILFLYFGSSTGRTRFSWPALGLLLQLQLSIENSPTAMR